MEKDERVLERGSGVLSVVTCLVDQVVWLLRNHTIPSVTISKYLHFQMINVFQT